MDFSKMTVDEIIDYLYTEALKDHVFSTDELDKAVDKSALRYRIYDQDEQKGQQTDRGIF